MPDCADLTGLGASEVLATFVRRPGQPFPHAVSSISGRVVNTTFTYDANGNQTAGNGLTLTYASFKVYV